MELDIKKKKKYNYFMLSYLIYLTLIQLKHVCRSTTMNTIVFVTLLVHNIVPSIVKAAVIILLCKCYTVIQQILGSLYHII